MALPRKPVPLDSPAVQAVRERMKPTDGTIVIAKTADSRIVEVRGDGTLVPYEAYIDPKESRALKPGMAEKYSFYWGNAHPRRIAELQGRNRWLPVKKGDGICFAPYAYGDHTDGLIHNDDTVLMHRPVEITQQIREENAIFNDPQRYLAQREEELTHEVVESAASALNEQGVNTRGLSKVKVTQTVEQDQEAIVFSQDTEAKG